MPNNTDAFEGALHRLAPSVVEETIRVTEIPAPTFREATRAAYVYQRFEEIGGWDYHGVFQTGPINIMQMRLAV